MKLKAYLFLILLLGMTACQQTDIPTPQTAVDCQVDHSTHPRAQLFQGLLQSFTDTSMVGLTLLVDHPVEGLWVGSSGWADIENEIPMTPCHLHFAASINKSYLGVMILQLAEEGKLSLDDRLDAYIDGDILDRIPNGREFTIRQLLQNRSGMPDTFEAEFLLDFLNQPTRQYSMEELMTFLYGVSPVSAPGESYYYGDGNFILLAMVIERLDGDLAQAFQTRIFDRIGASQSFLIHEPGELPDGMAASYWDRHENGVVENVSEYQVALAAGLEGADGLIASVQDLNLFLRGLSDGTLLTQDSYQEMIDVVDIPEGEDNQNYAAYGLGIAKVQLTNEVWYGSFGNHVGSAAMALYNPAHDVSIVAVQNTGTFFSDQAKATFFGYLVANIEAMGL